MLDLWSKNGYNKQVSCCGLMVKRLRHRPFTAESGVRFPLRLPKKLRFCLATFVAYGTGAYFFGYFAPNENPQGEFCANLHKV